MNDVLVHQSRPPLMPRWVMVWAKLEGLLPPLGFEIGWFSWVHEVGSGGGKCREKSGREPPVFMAGRRTGIVAGWSGDRRC